MIKRTHHDDDFEDEEKLAISRYIILVFNTVNFLAASMVFAGGMYITYDNTMGDYVGGLFMDFYLNATAVLMVASSIVVLNSFIGCCGGFLLSRRTLFLHIILTVVTFLMLLSASAYLLANGLEQSNLYPYIQETMRGLIYQYLRDMEAKTTVDKVQEYIGCCGGYGADDYISIHLPVPDTCRDQVTGNQYSDSCGEVLSSFMETRTGWMSGLSLCICFLQIFTLIVSIYAYKYINRLRRKV